MKARFSRNGFHSESAQAGTATVAALAERQTKAPSTNGVDGQPPASEAPSTNGVDGRDSRGRFTPGNKGGSGNPFARQVAALRAALIAEVTPDNVRNIARKLIERAE